MIEPLTQKQQHEATHEFIDALATNALNLPYVVKGRFGFAAAHLCHQANMLKHSDVWVDDLPLDSEIYPHVADRYGKPWKSYKGLKRALDAIGGAAFRDGTGDFRNAYNHRFSPRFVVGMTQLATRIVNKETGRVAESVRDAHHAGKDPADLDTLERPFRWGTERVSAEGLFTRIVETLDAPEEAVWHFLANIEVVGWSEAAITDEIESVEFLERLVGDESEVVEKAALVALRQRQADAETAELIAALPVQGRSRQWAWLHALVRRGDPAHLADPKDPRSIHSLLDHLGDDFREEANSLLKKRSKELAKAAERLEKKRRR